MSLPGHCLPPSSSLPAIRSLGSTKEEDLAAALHNLHALYCPLRIPLLLSPVKTQDIAAAPAPVDSGYASEDEDEDPEAALAALRADFYEKSFAMRWLTSLIARGEELDVEDEGTRSRLMDDAAFILSSFSDSAENEAESDIIREFSFPTCCGEGSINVSLNDAPLSGTDHTAVGLQSWGASIILSGLMCEGPRNFGLTRLHRDSTIVELGAGTGLVSLTLASLLPRLGTIDPTIIATDYHAAVLENMKANVRTNFGHEAEKRVKAELLDWANPSVVQKPVDMLIAADVVYAPEHAAMLRDCAGQLLSLEGTFWLIITVRGVGKFEGIADTVEAAFLSELCPRRDNCTLRILEKDLLEKRRGIGRGDEIEYRLYRIGWA